MQFVMDITRNCIMIQIYDMISTFIGEIPSSRELSLKNTDHINLFPSQKLNIYLDIAEKMDYFIQQTYLFMRAEPLPKKRHEASKN